MRLFILVVLIGSVGCELPGTSSGANQEPQRSLTFLNERGHLHLLTGEFSVPGEDAQSAARAFLAERARAYRLDEPGLTLVLAQEQVSLSGTWLRFEQHHRELPVFGGEVVVLVAGVPGHFVVRAVHLAVRDEVTGLISATPAPAAQALARALTVLEVTTPLVKPEVLTGVGVIEGTARLVHRVRVATARPLHDWELLLDAATLEVLSRRDRVRRVDGTALVFDTNPVASTGNTALRDNADANSPALAAARFPVTLRRLDGSGFTRGTWADVKRENSRVSSPTNTFDFDRSQPGFEQANVYFHLDRAQARLQALGFTAASNRQQVAVVDGAGWGDNSFYVPSTLELNFGTGGVDDAEDGEIVVHEYGHATQHDQVRSWGGGDEDSMGEGFGDYLAASFGEELAAKAGHAQVSDPECVGDWDAASYSTTTPKCLRRTDSAKHWPEALTGEVHDDGELWSAALWALRAQLGADLTDTLVVESHFLLGGTATFATAAQALQAVDQTLYGGAHLALIRRAMIQQGLSRQLSTPQPGSVVSSLSVSLDNPRFGATYRADLDHTLTYSVPGAAGLVVHFASIATERSTNPASTDNLYLTNAEGDLFQVFNGTHSNVSSVALVGDTVNLRLVTNSRNNFAGYHVDRIDIVGSLVVDAGVDAGSPDAGPPAGVDGGPDAGALDAGTADAGRSDAGLDAGAVDAGSDAGFDAGVPNTGVDAGVLDAGVLDAGALDAGVRDAGVPDAGVLDVGAFDAGGVPPRVAITLARDQLGKLPEATGCGCSSSSAIDLWLLATALGLLSQRRRRLGARPDPAPGQAAH